MTATTKSHPCTQKEFGGFWLPSYCPNALRTSRNRGCALVDADAVTWPGGTSKTFVAHYCCEVCGAQWSEDDWSVNWLPGGDPRRSKKRPAA